MQGEHVIRQSKDDLKILRESVNRSQGPDETAAQAASRIAEHKQRIRRTIDSADKLELCLQDFNVSIRIGQEKLSMYGVQDKKLQGIVHIHSFQ